MRQSQRPQSALSVRPFRVAAILFAALFGVCGVARVDGADPVPLPPISAETVPLFPTRQALFDIPFQIDPPPPGQEPTEVQLHVSENQGTNWSLHAKVTPQEGRFSYRAAHDGEFWFLVRTLSRTGKLLPERPFEPELRALVDTVPPTLELDLQRGTAGDIVVQWKTSDPNLKLETLQLSYQGVDGGANWQSIVAGNSQPGADGKWTGSTSFVPSGALPPIYVRAEVADAAGNQGRTQAQLQPRAGDPATNPNSLPSTMSPRPLAQSLETRRDNTWQPAAPGTPIQSPNYPSGAPSSGWSNPPAMSESRPFGGSSAGRVSDPPSMAKSFPGREQIPPGLDSGGYSGMTGGNVANPGMIAGNSSMSGAMAGSSVPEALPGLETIPPGRTNRNSPASAPSNLGGSPTTKKDDVLVGETIGPGDAEVLPTPTPIPSRTETRGGSIVDGAAGPGPSFGSPAGTGLPDLTSSAESGTSRESLRPSTGGGQSSTSPSVSSIAGEDGPTPAGIKPRLVNSRRFELDYDVESVGTAGVAKVELWGTRDGGKSWSSLGNDPDSTSPYVVIVDREGVYGFRIVIESTTGLRSPSPQPGELPEVWVGVDVTKPDCRITSAQVGEGDRAGEMEVRWEAKDASLTSRPVALAFSENSEGPWTMIASGLSNTGSYIWRIDSRMPTKMYLKIDVRDEAGNTGTFITPEPVAIQRVRPQGKIRGVRPIGESARLRMPAELPKR